MTDTDAPEVRSIAVIGVGNRFRGDDGIGPVVIERLAVHGPAGVDLVALDGEPTRLIECWAGRALVIVVDAMRSGALPGTIEVVRVGDGSAGLPAWTHGGGSHSLGLADAIDLGEAVGRRPTALVIIGVEGADFGDGADLSPPVCHVIDEVLRLVLDAIEPAPSPGEEWTDVSA